MPSLGTRLPTAARRASADAASARPRGQVAVIFAGAMLLFALLAATVIDLSWYWTNNLRMQRAADSAALAGVVFLPSQVSQAVTAARAEARKNGYEHGVGGVTVTPVQDPSNDRRLFVTINGPVGTYFARAVGITSWNAQRTAKADYVLPVPMGSPQHYYGVGFYQGRVPTTNLIPGNTDWNTTALSVTGGQWTSPNNAFSNDNVYTTEDTSNHYQQWTNFNLQAEIPNDPTLVIDGLEVRLQDVRLLGSGTATNCHMHVGVSWNGGVSWTPDVDSVPLTTSDTDPVIGTNSSLATWTPHTTWTRNEFANGTFRVRLGWEDSFAACAATRDVQLDQLEVRVQYHTSTTTYADQVLSVNDPLTGTALASQGFWGAIFTSGGIRENGDRHAPSFLGNGTGAPAGNANPNYDPGGYDYLIELPGGSGQVRLFDPVYCATGPNGTGGSYGAGDHWTGTPTGQIDAPVSVTYRLYNTNGTPANEADDGAPVATLTYDPGSATLGDFSGAFGTPSNQGDANAQDCSTHPAHHQWVNMSPSALASGVYRLNVNTSLDSDNLNTGAENLFSIWASSAGSARVFGSGRMAAYTNLAGGLQAFYFAQIENVHAGKQMVIELFDPGEVSGNGFLRFQNPDGNVYNYATFDWVSDDGRSGNDVTQIQTSINGAAQFNNRLLTITVDLPATYGSTGLNPPGDVTSEQGWWRVEYNVTGGNDTTTWAVSIRGNPVHLVLP
jgi:Flp pilus assembly protein TadG